MEKYDSLKQLTTSTIYEDLIRHDLFIRLLDILFKKHDNIVIDGSLETPDNQALIKRQSKVLSVYYKIPGRVFSTQRCVRQTLKHMVDFLNQTYQFQHPILFVNKRETIREGSYVYAKSYTILNSS